MSAISFPAHGSHIYTAGADGMVCEIEAMSGNLLNKFSAASRAISSLAVSPGTSHILFSALISFNIRKLVYKFRLIHLKTCKVVYNLPSYMVVAAVA